MTASFHPARVLDFHGKTAVVTGGGNGIGQGVALALALAGAKVAVFDHDGQAAQATCERIQAQGGAAWPVARNGQPGVKALAGSLGPEASPALRRLGLVCPCSEAVRAPRPCYARVCICCFAHKHAAHAGGGYGCRC